MVIVIMSSMNSSIEAYFASKSTDSWSAWNSGSCPGCYSSSMSIFLWSDWSSVAYHDFPLRISLSRSITDSLTVVYSVGAGVVPNGKWRHRRARFLLHK